MQISPFLIHLICLKLALWHQVDEAAASDTIGSNGNNNTRKLIKLTINVPKLRTHRAHLSLCDPRLHIIRERPPETRAADRLTVFNVSPYQPTPSTLGNSSTPAPTHPIKSQLLVPDRRLECEPGEVLSISSLQELTFSHSGPVADLTFDGSRSLSFNQRICETRLARLVNSSMLNGKGGPLLADVELLKVGGAKYQQVCENMMTVEQNLLQGLINECQANQNCTVPVFGPSEQRDCTVLDRLGLSQRLEVEYQCVPGGGQSRFGTRTVNHHDLSNRVACPAGRLLYLARAAMSPQSNASQCGNSTICGQPTNNGISSSQSEDSSSSSWLHNFLRDSETSWAKYKFEDLDSDGSTDGESRQEGDVNFSGRAARRKRAAASVAEQVPGADTNQDTALAHCSVLIRAIESCHGKSDCSLSLGSLALQIGATRGCNSRASREIYGPHKLSFDYLCLESSKWATPDSEPAAGAARYVLTFSTHGGLIQSETIASEHNQDGPEVLFITELGSITLQKWLREKQSAPTGRLPSASSSASPAFGRPFNRLSYGLVVALSCLITQLLLARKKLIQIKTNQLS